MEPRSRSKRRLDGSHWLRYRGRYLHLRACPEPLRHVRKSFRPTASRTCGTNAKTQKQNQTQIPLCTTQTTLGEKSAEADISIWHKTLTFLLCVDTKANISHRCKMRMSCLC